MRNHRSPAGTYDRRLARRVQWEREQRGLSYEALARAVSETGCHMNPSAAFKIEKGSPPRKITVDEFVAFARVFGHPLDEMLVPPEEREGEITDLMIRYVAILQRDGEARDNNELGEILSELSARLGGMEAATSSLRVHVERWAGLRP